MKKCDIMRHEEKSGRHVCIIHARGVERELAQTTEGRNSKSLAGEEKHAQRKILKK